MQGIVERKTTIPVISHLRLTTSGDRLQLAATDLDVSLTSWCEAEVTAEGGIAVQAKKLMEIVRSLGSDEITLSQPEPKTLAIKAGSSRFKIHGLAPEDFPTLWRWSARVLRLGHSFCRLQAHGEQKSSLRYPPRSLVSSSMEHFSNSSRGQSRWWRRMAIGSPWSERRGWPASKGEDAVLVPRKAVRSCSASKATARWPTVAASTISHFGSAAASSFAGFSRAVSPTTSA